MDPVTLGLALMLVLGLVGTDAALHSGAVTVDLEVGAGGSLQGVGEAFAEALICAELQRVVDTKSFFHAPQLRGAREPSVATSLTDWLKLRELARAVQLAFGAESAQVRASVSGDTRHKKLVVLGHSSYARGFTVEIASSPEEPTVDLLRRAAFEIALQLEPYFAALSRVEAVEGETIDETRRLIERLIEAQPPLPIDPRRARLLNLLGILDLMEGKLDAAGGQFGAALLADQSIPVHGLNLSFVDIRAGRIDTALAQLDDLLRSAAVRGNPILLATTYAMRATALVARGDHRAAEAAFRAAARAYPHSSVVYDTWSRYRAERGDALGAARLAETARANAVHFENYPELALLHFELTWRRDLPLTRSPWRNPDRPPQPNGGFWRRVTGLAGVVDWFAGAGDAAPVR